MRVRVAIPHFFCEGVSDVYGSGRLGNRLPRSVALARCLGGLLALDRSPNDWILNMAESHVELSPSSKSAGLSSFQVELHVFVIGDDWLKEVVGMFASRIHVHRLVLEDPRLLPLAAVRRLLDMVSPADLSMYLEDDLIVQDPRYLDKLWWFHQRTEDRFVLMPHRFEPTVKSAPQRLYVDGPIKEDGQSQQLWASDEAVVASGRFWDGYEVSFCEASNPHSGSFCISSPQLQKLRHVRWPPETFIGPLETAATGTILGQFPVLKPSWPCREFLALEHGNPSFLRFLNIWPHREIS